MVRRIGFHVSGLVLLSLIASAAHAQGLKVGDTDPATGFAKHMVHAAQVPPALVALTAKSPPPTDPGTLARLEAYIAQAPSPVTGTGQAVPPPEPHIVTGSLAAGATPDQAAIDAMMSLEANASQAVSPTSGLASGQAINPYMPSTDDFGHAAAQAIVAAFAAPKGQTAEDQAEAAAAQAPDDPAFAERVALVMTLYQVDGTDAVIRHYVDTQQMKLIITEVGNHIDIGKLSQTDKYRLAAIAAMAQTELEDKIITMNARIQAANLSKDELMQLIAAYDTDAQRKQTQLRLHDDGKLDKLAGIDVVISEYRILYGFIVAN